MKLNQSMQRGAKLCPCGSGLERRELCDARGIFCCYVCDSCEREKRAGYAPGVLTDRNYEAEDLGDDDEARESERAWCDDY